MEMVFNFNGDSLNYNPKTCVISGVVYIYDIDNQIPDAYEIAFKYYTDTKELFVFNLKRTTLNLTEDLKQQFIDEIVKIWKL